MVCRWWFTDRDKIRYSLIACGQVVESGELRVREFEEMKKSRVIDQVIKIF